MKFVIVFAALVAVCIAAPSESDVAAVALKDIRQQDPKEYKFDIQTSNGISHQETGIFQNGSEHENPALTVSGSAKWTSPEGIAKNVLYTADRYGYHPVISKDDIN